MALTRSNEFLVGTNAPDFTLPNTVDDTLVSLSELKGTKATVIFFICNHCPFVIHINAALVKIANAYQHKGIAFIAISSNEIEQYPQDGPEQMKAVAKQQHYPFPYLFE